MHWLHISKTHINIILLQSLEAELICSTAYVDLFIRRITEPSLLAVFLRFIFTDVCDDKNIIDTLVARLGLHSQVNISFSTCMNTEFNIRFLAKINHVSTNSTALHCYAFVI